MVNLEFLFGNHPFFGSAQQFFFIYRGCYNTSIKINIFFRSERRIQGMEGGGKSIPASSKVEREGANTRPRRV